MERRRRPPALPPPAPSPRARGSVVGGATPAAFGTALYMSRIVTLPIFPLAGAILFPRSQLPLHIFEQRYREMVRDATDGPGRIGMVQPLRFGDDGHPPL